MANVDFTAISLGFTSVTKPPFHLNSGLYNNKSILQHREEKILLSLNSTLDKTIVNERFYTSKAMQIIFVFLNLSKFHTWKVIFIQITLRRI